MLGRLLRIVCMVFIVLAFMGVGVRGYNLLSDDYDNYKNEMKCVHKLVSHGVERKDIKQVNGKCYVSTNAYYSSIN